MKCLGLHNKPTAEVHLGHMLTGPKEEEAQGTCIRISALHIGHQYKFGQHQLVVLVASNRVHANFIHSFFIFKYMFQSYILIIIR
jgi:hypothetical protein